MKKEQFEILMYALYGNNQLFIPQGQTIQEWIDNAFDNAMKQGQSLPIDSVVRSAEVPAVRVRNYNEETGETENGTVIEATLNTYLVIPDYNLSMTVRWDKMNCDVLR